MSQEKVELLRRITDAYNRRDLDAYVALMDPDVEITSRLRWQSSYHGHDGVRAYLQDWLETFPDLRIEIDEVRDLGDVVLVRMRARGHGAGSDAPFQDLFWITARARGGKCVWWHAHDNKAAALEAAGLRE